MLFPLVLCVVVVCVFGICYCLSECFVFLSGNSCVLLLCCVYYDYYYYSAASALASQTLYYPVGFPRHDASFSVDRIPTADNASISPLRVRSVLFKGVWSLSMRSLSHLIGEIMGHSAPFPFKYPYMLALVWRK